MSDFDSLPCLLSVRAVKRPRGGGGGGASVLLHSLTFCCFLVFFGGGFFFLDGSQDCLQTVSPPGRIIGDHAVHPSCRLRLLPGAFPSVQTVSEVHPGAAVQRARCRHRVCQVRTSSLYPTSGLSIKQLGCADTDTPALGRQSEASEMAVELSAARLVSSVQAVMATSAGYIIASSCEDIIEDQ